MQPPITLAFSGFLPPTSMSAGSSAPIAVLVTNDPTNSGVNFTVTCASSLCGSFDPVTIQSSQPVPTTYTAPSSIPSGGNVKVTATSVKDATKSISATINIT